MKESDRQSPFAPPQQTSNKQASLIAEAQDIFEKMKREAIRQNKLDQAHARMRGPFTRFLLALSIISALCAAVIFAYGIYNFPDAPIRPARNGYVGKRGSLHTQAEYEAFRTWQTAMLISFPSVFITSFAFAMADRKKRVQ